MRFLDTNVILRYLTGDDQARAQAGYELFQRVQRGEEELATCETIVAEVIYVLSSPRLPYRLDPAQIRARLLPILTLRGLKLLHKHVCLRGLDVYASFPSLDFEDALAVAHMEQLGISRIVSYDRDFDRVAGVRRTEP